MLATAKRSPKSWLAFDVNVLRRARFASAALPFCDTPELAAYLKRMKVRVAANDPLQSAWTRLAARLANIRQRPAGEADAREAAARARCHPPGLSRQPCLA